jgi:KDO2-lipid IV(A) lauroyltransferase
MIELALGLLARMVARLPFLWMRALGVPLAWVCGSVLRLRRAHVEAALHAGGWRDPARVARRVYRSLGASVMELLWLSRRPAEALAEVASLEPASRRAFDTALALGRGVVLAASHTGNWELAACVMARSLDLLVVTKPIREKALDRFMTHVRTAHGLRLAPPEGALLSARDALARGGCVAMLIDQVPDFAGHGIALEFLGGRALADRAPAALSASTGAPLVVVAFRRDARGRHVIHVLRVLLPPARDRRAWTVRATRQASAALEAFVRSYPSEWLWLHRRWRAPRSSRPCLLRASSLHERHA